MRAAGSRSAAAPARAASRVAALVAALREAHARGARVVGLCLGAFVVAAGSCPSQWLLRQRLVRARVLLETTDAPVDQVAAAAGFGSSAALRQHFARTFRTSPSQYRARFRTGVGARS